MKIATLKYREVTQTSIFKPNYHLNIGKRSLVNLLNKGVKCVPLGNIVQKVYTGGIFKRVFVKSEKTGIPYISAQNMMTTNPSKFAKLISRKYTPRQNDMTLKENTILVSCAGTVGNIRLIDASFKNIIGSQDIIRVIPNSPDYGFIYAYLSSNVCYNYIQSLIYGSVVPRIEPNAVANIPIPIFPESKQQEIHNLIVESANLRVEANRLLEEAKNAFIKNQELKTDLTKTKIIDFSLLRESNRFSGYYNLSLGAYYEEQIKKKKYISLFECIEDIFTSGRDKRNYSGKKGIPFLSNTDLSNINPFKNCNYILRCLNEKSIIKENMILTGRVGQDTVGQFYLPYKSILGSIASDNVIRIVVNEKIEKEYIFAFMSSDIGKHIVKRRKTGVGQPFITEDMLRNIPILLLPDVDRENIVQKIKKYAILLDSALIKETQAIHLVEKEISLWQQS